MESLPTSLSDDDENDVLVVGCDSDDDIDGFLKCSEEVSSTKSKMKKETKFPPKSRRQLVQKISSLESVSSSEHVSSFENVTSLEDDMALSDEESAINVKERDEVISEQMRKDFLLNFDKGEESDENDVVIVKEKKTCQYEEKEAIVEEDMDINSADLEDTIYSLGNYCTRMLRGKICSREKCSWIHYMTPKDAVNQFFRIFSNRSLADTLQFYRYFTNVEIQERLLTDAQDKIGAFIGIDPKEICREVLRAMVRVSSAMELSLKECMEMVDISTGVFNVNDGKETLVTIFDQTLSLINDSGGKVAKQEAKRLVKWAWSHLYLASVNQGVQLPAKFYSELCNMLPTQNMIPELVEVLLYVSMIPSLKVPLRGLADVLMCSEKTLTSPHSNAVFTGQILSRLKTPEWVSLYGMVDIKPGLEILVKCLSRDDPVDVYKFYESLPEIDGIIIPVISAPPLAQDNIWMRNQLVAGDWKSVAEYLCSLKPSDLERIHDLTEMLLMELSQLCGEFALKAPLSDIFKDGAAVIVERKSELQCLYWCQLGVSLLICEVTSSQWLSAVSLSTVLSRDLQVDWLRMKPCSISQFTDIDTGVVTLFLLESLVKTNRSQELVNYLNQWDCLVHLESELEKRDLILLGVLECLAVTNVDGDVLDVIVRVNEVMAPGMKKENNVIVRRRQEVMSNVTFMLMLNHNSLGNKLYKRFLEVKACGHILEVAVIRGLVTLLASARNNLIKEATNVYIYGVKLGLYSIQHSRRPLTLKLTSIFSMEEFYIIVREFLTRVNKMKNKEDSLNIYVKIEEKSVPNCGVTLLNRIGCGMKNALPRFEKILESPLQLTKASVPHIEDEFVRQYLASSFHDQF